MPNLTIVVLQYNNALATVECIRSLNSQLDSDTKLIVIDNGSDHREQEQLRSYIDQIHNLHTTLLETGENLGFSGGNNIGIQEGIKNGSNWVILLNNDTVVPNGFIERLKAELEAKNGVIGLGLDEGGRTAYAGKVKWLSATLHHIYKPDLVTPRLELGTKAGHHYYAIGAAMAVYKSVFEKIGLLDERYFLYFEDADFSVRARKAGIPVTFLPEIKIRHATAQSTKELGSPLLLRYHYRNALIFNKEHAPRYLKWLIWPWIGFIISKQAIKILINRNRSQSRAILGGVFDFLNAKYGKI